MLQRSRPVVALVRQPWCRDMSRVVILSAYHDYRTPKRASIQPLADAYVRAGHEVSFISTRYSWLSRRTGDSRLFLWDRANQAEQVDGVDCYLWRTPLHPFHARRRWVNAMTGAMFEPFSGWPNDDVDARLTRADYVIIESSVAAIYLRRIRRLNPGCRIIYYATDRLDTHGAHPEVIRMLRRDGHLIDHFALRSSRIMDGETVGAGSHYVVPFGIHPPDFEASAPSPYSRPFNAVSVGSGLFDPGFFAETADAFPDVDFHVIGCGTHFEAPANVHLYPEMAFRQTLPYLKHASIGIAPYRWAPASDYIADTSLKLAQFAYLGKPAVCPRFAAGNRPSRFAYDLGNGDSMRTALRTALSHVGKVLREEFLSWDDVAKQVLNPPAHARLPLQPASVS
jgi:2-beta-glucuronyltransferase